MSRNADSSLRAVTTSAILGTLIGISSLFAGAGPAAAATGGGCGAWDPVDPCVSFAFPNLNGDFYRNYDTDTYCYAQFGLYENGVLRKSSGLISLRGRTGRISGLSVSVDNLPDSNNSGYSRVIVYNCSMVTTFVRNSPRVYYRS